MPRATVKMHRWIVYFRSHGVLTQITTPKPDPSEMMARLHVKYPLATDVRVERQQWTGVAWEKVPE